MTAAYSQDNETGFALPMQSQNRTVDRVVSERSLRGLSGQAASELAELDRRLNRSRMENPMTYLLADRMGSDQTCRYRSGNDDGESYMTVDDYISLWSDEGARLYRQKSPLTVLREKANQRNTRPVNLPAVPYRCAETAKPGAMTRQEAVFCGKTETETAVVQRDRQKKHSLRRIFRAYTGGTYSVRAGIPIRQISSALAAISMVAVMALLLVLPISMKILIHNENTEISRLNTEIRREEAEVRQLEIELNEKNDLAQIEELARNEYGMVRLDATVYTVLRVNVGDVIENTEKEQRGGAVPALLNALGLRGRQ